MNSAILNILIKICVAFSNVFKQSYIYKVFLNIYTAISNSWKNSIIIGWLKSDMSHSGKISFLSKLGRLPFDFLEFMNKKIGRILSDSIKDSFIINCFLDFSENILALNTKVLGVYIIAAVFSKNIILPHFSIIAITVLLLGLFLSFVNYNITDFFNDSKVVSFILDTLGFSNIKWNFYNNEKNKSIKAVLVAILLGAFGGILSTKSLILIVAPLIAVTGIFTVLQAPLVGVYSAVFLAPFVPTMILVGIILLTSFATLLKSVCEKDFTWKIEGVGINIIYFLAFMLLSSLFSFARTKSMMVWGIYLIFLTFFFTVTNVVKTKKQLYGVIKVFLIAGAIVSIYGVLQYVFNWNTSNAWIDEEMFENATMRAYSTMENPNVLGEFLLILIPFSAFFMVSTSYKRLEKYVWIATFVIAVLCMVFTQSRGCWIGLLFASAIFITFYNGKLWGLLPFALLAIPFFMPETMIERFLSVGNLEDSSTSYRVFIWLGTIIMLKDFWIGGIGMGEGAFRSVYPFYSFNSIIAPHSHNLYLQLLVEGGIGALIIFLITMIVFYKKTSDIYVKNGRKDKDSILALTIISGVSGFLIQSLFDYTFYNYRMMAMFFMTLAFASTLSLTKGEKDNESY